MNVNYMMEIIALDEWELTHPLEPTAYKVLRKLYYLANKERFPERISVPNTILMALVGCGEDSLNKARNKLIQVGRIEYKGQKKLTPMYKIHYFSLDVGYNPKISGYGQGIERGMEQGVERGIARGMEQGTYINKTKEKETEQGEEADRGITAKKTTAHVREGPFPARQRVLPAWEQAVYEQLREIFEGLPMFERRRRTLLSLLESDRFGLDLVMTAYEATEKRDRRYPLDNPGAYLLELLHDWEERGLRTGDDVRDSKDDWWDRA